MVGGIMAGASQVLSGGFKLVANMQNRCKGNVGSGIKIGKSLKILSPDKLFHKTNGGTLIKVGNLFRIDVNSMELLHLHLPMLFSEKHLPLGIFISGLYGVFKK